jgi:hypothetical protein
MKSKIAATIGLLALTVWATGCAGPSRLEMDYGTSCKLARFNQTYDLQAGKNLDPVTGMDGGAAKYITDKYRKDFEKPAASTSNYIFSIGTGSGTSSK